MSTYYTVVFIGLGITLIGSAILSRVPAFQDWQADRLGRRVGLGVPVELEASLRRRMGTRILAMNVGGLIGLGLGVAVFLGVRLGDDVVGAYLALALTATGAAVGAVVAALRSETRSDDRPRIARAEAVGMGDYVVVLARVLAWAVIALAVATLVVSALMASGLAPDAPGERIRLAGLALAIVGLLCFVVFEVAGRRIVGRGRPSASTDELVWNDALTSAALRDILVAPVQAVVLGAWFSVLWSAGGSAWLSIVLALVMMAALVAFAIVFRSTATWYLTQLWPGARRRTRDEEAARLASGSADVAAAASSARARS